MKPARAVSLGTRLAIQYGLALLASLALFAVLVEAQVERRISREAQLLLRLQLVDLVDDFTERRRADGWERAVGWLSDHASLLARSADPSIGLGIQLLDSSGAPVFSAGSLAGAQVPVDRTLIDGRRHQSFRAVNLGERHAYLSLTEAVPDGFLRVAVDTARFTDNVEDIRRIFLISIPLVLLVSSGAGYFLSRRAIRPISHINRVARQVSSQRLDAQIPTTGAGDELDQLAETLNAMMERIRSGVDRLGRFSANVAHELRSPLNRVQNRLESLSTSRPLDDRQREEIEAVQKEVETLAQGIESMLRLARFERGLEADQKQPVDLRELVETVVAFFEPEARSREIGIETDLRAEVTVPGDATWLQMMVSNLVSNAIKYGRSGDRVVVGLNRAPGEVHIAVADSGPGISADLLGSIFERFERGGEGPRRPGFGLGLPIAREIARAHGGDIHASSGPGHGTRFVVTIPVLD